MVHWGLIPSWAKEAAIGNRMINARSETIAEKPAFRSAFARWRCLVPIDGFYEWRKIGAAKQHMLIEMPGEALFCFAGLWERWKDPQTDLVIDSMTILTTSANAMMKEIHDRMPVILNEQDYDRWLDRQTSPETLSYLLVPYPQGKLTARPVSSQVNSPKNDDPSYIAPLT